MLNKWLSIGLSITISAFLGANAILLFSDKSTITKTLYVHNFERVATGSYEEKYPKEALVAPAEISTVYVKDEDTVDGWLVQEGDVVQAGTELAHLNTTSADEQRSIWESEREAIERQITEINSTISSLQSDRSIAKDNNNSDTNQNDTVTGDNDEQSVEVDINVDVDVDVQQDGAFAQAISEAEQKLAEANRELQVVEAQLVQKGTTAIISPKEGIVSAIREDNGRLAVDIYSTQKVIVTYATDEQWQDIQANDRVRIQADGLDTSVEGIVLSVAQVPATDSTWLNAYKALDPEEQTNPLAYYEILVQPNEPIENLPFGINTNADILVNEASDAVSIKSEWLHDRFEEKATAHVLTSNGYAIQAPVTILFDLETRSILNSGMVAAGSIIVHEPNISDYQYAPAVFFPMPMDFPTLDSVKNTGWKFYLKHLIF